MHGTYNSIKGFTPLHRTIDGVENWDELTICFLGDVNRDGLITITDAIALTNIVLGLDTDPPYQYDHDASDMNGDGILTVTDVILLTNLIVNDEM